MNNLLLITTLLFHLTVFSQTPSLIFHSGFEPNTDTTAQGSNSADIIGTDLSVSIPNDWVNDLETHPNIGTFSIQYQGGNDTMRLAQIKADPINMSNKALWFWIKNPNVSGTKGRIQGNIYNNSGITNLYYSIRLFLPSDFNLLKNMLVQIKWLTLMEFWNNPNWINDPYPFRVTVNLQKIGTAPDSLRFGAHGQTFDTITSTWSNVWDTTNTSFVVPVGKWMKIEVHYIEGNNNTGRFKLTVTPDNSLTTVVLDITNYTHHPLDPAPDGLSHFNPFKLYTSAALINSVRASGGILNVYWDDFELWKDSLPISGISNNFFKTTPFNIYPNPFSSSTTLQTDNPLKNATLTVYNLFGQTVKEIKNINGQTVVLNRDNLTTGLYFIQLTEENKIIMVDKLVITD